MFYLCSSSELERFLPSLAAMRDGKGGQQKRQQRSRIESVFIVRSSGKQNEKDINNKCPRNNIDWRLGHTVLRRSKYRWNASDHSYISSRTRRGEGEKQACCRFLLLGDEYMQRCFLTTSSSSRSTISVSEVKSEETCWVSESLVFPWSSISAKLFRVHIDSRRLKWMWRWKRQTAAASRTRGWSQSELEVNC